MESDGHPQSDLERHERRCTRLLKQRVNAQVPPESMVEDEREETPLAIAEAIKSATFQEPTELYPRSWKQARETIVNQALAPSTSQEPTLGKKSRVVIQIIGSSNAGKASFARVLLSSILAPPEGLGFQPGEAVALLDLDPTKCEFSLPGHISLSMMRIPTELSTSSFNPLSKAVQSHAIGLDGHQEDPGSFLAAMNQLLQTYQKLSENSAHILPLLICCPSFERESEGGMDSRLTANLIRLLNATNICCLAYKSLQQSQNIDIIREAKQKLTVLWELDTQNPTRTAPLHSPEELRSLCLRKYFHKRGGSRSRYLASVPLTHQKPYIINYSQGSSNIGGVFLFGEVPPMYSGMLSRILNGSIVAITVLNDDYEYNDTILRGQGDKIPYFDPGVEETPEPLDPAQSESVGLGLVRSIDPKTQQFHIIMPQDVASRLASIDADRIVLVHGVADSPGWAYRDCEQTRRTNSMAEMELFELGKQYRDAMPLYLGKAKKGMQVVKSRRFKKKQ